MISFLDRASEGNEALYELFMHFSLAAGFVLAMVVGATVYALVKFRGSRNRNPRQFSGNKRVEAIALAIAVGLVGYFGYKTITMMGVIHPERGDRAPDVVVTGHQWWWQTEYPASGVVTANEFHVPVGRKILVELRSSDVIHSLWIPNLAGKQDMIPGYGNHLWLEVKRPGRYMGTCGEFCGKQHAWMRMKVVAHPEEEFDQWLENHAHQANLPTDNAQAMRGAAIFTEKSCRSCHSIGGYSEGRQTGPDLTHVGSREYLAGGVVKNTPANLRRWLKDPYEIKPGAHMPDMHLTEREIDDLVAFLSRLK